jgi:hypothetical protein
MTATRSDLRIKRSDDLDFIVQVWADDAHTVVQNITNWTAKMQIKDSYKAGAAVLATYLSGAEITVLGPAGQLVVHVAGSVTSAYTWRQGVYDLFVYGPSNNPTKCVAEGDVTVHARVTT